MISKRQGRAGGRLAAAALAIVAALQPAAALAADETGPPGWQTDLALWSLISFLILLAILKRFAWGPITRGLDTREARIQQDIANAEAGSLRAERMLAEHAAKLAAVQDDVKAILAEARQDAEHTKQDIIAEARSEAEASRKRAIVDIERARDAAMMDLFDSMTDLVTEATAHVVGRTLGDGDQNRLIDEALVQFQRDRALRN